MDIEKKHKRIKILVTLMLAIITFAIVGFSYAYFQPQIGNASADVTVITKTTDVLTFNKGNDITIQPTQANFGSGAGNKTGTTTATATLLANNDTNSASETYNVYFEITGNSLMYTTAPTNTPELLLTITDPTGNPVTSLTGLTYTTVNGVSGFDITTKKGLIQIANNYTITSTGTKTDTWTITVTFVNLNSDQSANSTRKFSCNAIIQKSEITTATLDNGQNVHDKIDALVNNNSVNSVKAIKKANTLPNGFTATANNTISLSSGSQNPVYIWFEEDTVTNDGTVTLYYYSIADRIYLNVDSSNLFNNMNVLNDISDLSFFNSSYVTVAENMFYSCYSITSLASLSNWDMSSVVSTRYMFSGVNVLSLSSLSNWDVSSVTDMGYMFCWIYELTNLSGLENWNISSVTNMESLFWSNTKLNNITALTNWDVSSVTDMSGMFCDCTGLTTLTPITNWDVSSVTDIGSMFFHCSGITSLTAISKWNISSVTGMGGLFSGTQITSLTPISNWDVASVTNMRALFSNTQITSLTPISNWDVSSVTDMSYMFSGCSSLTDASAINDWDVTNIYYNHNANWASGFYNMFNYANGVNPTFSKREGTWDSEGSFIPSA